MGETRDREHYVRRVVPATAQNHRSNLGDEEFVTIDLDGTVRAAGSWEHCNRYVCWCTVENRVAQGVHGYESIGENLD